MRYFIFFSLGVFFVFYGWLGIQEKEVFAIFYQTTVRWVYGSEAVFHSKIYIGLGAIILVFTLYALLKKISRKSDKPKPR